MIAALGEAADGDLERAAQRIGAAFSATDVVLDELKLGRLRRPAAVG